MGAVGLFLEFQKQANRAHALFRSAGERTNAQLKAGESSVSSAAASGVPVSSKAILVLQIRAA